MRVHASGIPAKLPANEVAESNAQASARDEHKLLEIRKPVIGAAARGAGDPSEADRVVAVRHAPCDDLLYQDREHLDVSAKRPRTASSTSRVAPNSSSRGVTLCMRGLNIQWPFSQLLLMGAKTEEVREYDLGHRSICKADEEVWIVETKGPHAKARTNAISDGLELAPRPSAAQIVGTVSFSGAFPYRNIEDFASARERHRIAIDSKYDWDGSGSRFGWQVARVRKLAKPTAAESTGMTGFGSRSFTVEFADPDVCDDVGMEVESAEVASSARACPEGAISVGPASQSSSSHCRNEEPFPKCPVVSEACQTAVSPEVLPTADQRHHPFLPVAVLSIHNLVIVRA